MKAMPCSYSGTAPVTKDHTIAIRNIFMNEKSLKRMDFPKIGMVYKIDTTPAPDSKTRRDQSKFRNK